MLIYSQDRKNVLDCRTISVTRNFGGSKDKKYALVATAGYGTMVNGGIVGTYPDEKTAMDELEKIFAAFEGGAVSYKL